MLALIILVLALIAAPAPAYADGMITVSDFAQNTITQIPEDVYSLSNRFYQTDYSYTSNLTRSCNIQTSKDMSNQVLTFQIAFYDEGAAPSTVSVYNLGSVGGNINASRIGAVEGTKIMFVGDIREHLVLGLKGSMPYYHVATYQVRIPMYWQTTNIDIRLSSAPTIKEYDDDYGYIYMPSYQFLNLSFYDDLGLDGESWGFLSSSNQFIGLPFQYSNTSLSQPPSFSDGALFRYFLGDLNQSLYFVFQIDGDPSGTPSVQLADQYTNSGFTWTFSGHRYYGVKYNLARTTYSSFSSVAIHLYVDGSIVNNWRLYSLSVSPNGYSDNLEDIFSQLEAMGAAQHSDSSTIAGLIRTLTSAVNDFESQNNTDLTSLKTAINNFKAAMQTELDQEQSLIENGFTETNDNLTDFYARNHADIAALQTALTTAISNFKNAQHTDITTLQAKMQAEFDAFELANHTDLVAIYNQQVITNNYLQRLTNESTQEKAYTDAQKTEVQQQENQLDTYESQAAAYSHVTLSDTTLDMSDLVNPTFLGVVAQPIALFLNDNIFGTCAMIVLIAAFGSYLLFGRKD